MLANVCRLLLAVTFLFSGFVKLNDPLGTQYKIEDYAHAFGLAALAPQPVPLVLSVVLAMLEFCLGVWLFFGINRRRSVALAILLMAVFTPLTLYLAIANPVQDCGCFGDALLLTNWQTFWKNVLLLCAALVL
ncbi:MAG: DoxX family membrane protein, partial [Bacteroidaceae bacterium]|nr:DoxX family membrane protein [Bacteroidaceae bacterium]